MLRSSIYTVTKNFTACCTNKILSKLQIPDLSGISLLTNKRTIGGVNWDLRHVVALVVALCQWGVENNHTLTKKPPRTL